MMKVYPLLTAAVFFHALGTASVFSQEAAPVAQASLTVVNAVPGDKNVFISFDGQSIWPPGFTAGQSTAAVMFPAGRKKIGIECDGYAKIEASMDLPAGANCAIIMYPGELVGEGPDKGKRRIGVFVPPSHQAPAKPVSGKRWKIVLVGAEKSAEVEVNGKKMLLSAKTPADLSPGSDGVSVKHQGRDILGVAPEEAGEYWVVVFPADGGLSAVLLNHSPFKVPSA
jgi:hypothetical protein